MPALPVAAHTVVRSMCTGASYEDKVRVLRDQVQSENEVMTKEMRLLYGEDGTAVGWMHHYLRSPHPQFAASALQLMSNDSGAMETAEASFVHFTAQVLRDLSSGDDKQEALTDFASRAVMLDGARPDLILSVLHQVDTPQARDWYDRLLKSIGATEDGSTSFAFEYGNKLQNTPVKDIMSWDIPFLNVERYRGQMANPNQVFHMTGYLDHSLRELGEKADAGGEASETAFHTWISVASKTLLDGLWAHYWATGDTGYVRRAISFAVPWLEFEATTDIQAVLSPELGLPEDLKGATDKATRARISAGAFLSLIVNSHMHRGVIRALTEEVAAGADVFLEESMRTHAVDPEQEARQQKRALFCANALHLLARMRAENSSTV